VPLRSGVSVSLVSDSAEGAGKVEDDAFEGRSLVWIED